MRKRTASTQMVLPNVRRRRWHPLQSIVLKRTVLEKSIGAIVLFTIGFWWTFRFANDAIMDADDDDSSDLATPCAILFFGLPRQFRVAVLPGLVQNVLPFNTACDYYGHFYNNSEEKDYRGADQGRHGSWDSQEMLLLSEHVVKFTSIQESEAEFYSRYQPLLQDILDPHSIYQTDSYSNASLTNVVKMWHSQQAVFQLMESSGVHYSTVALLRNDVLFVNPFPDLSQTSSRVATAPGFGKFPVSDRYFYGPYDAARIWATGKFSRLARHVQSNRRGLHSETILAKTIFPAIRNAGVEIVENTNVCCLRVRADVSIRLQDCGRACGTNQDNVAHVEALLQRTCHLNTENPDVAILECYKASLERRNSAVTAWQACPWKPQTGIFSMLLYRHKS